MAYARALPKSQGRTHTYNTVVLALIGERGTRRWAVLTGTVAAADGKPRELLRCALLRAKLSELIAPPARYSEYEGFLIGLFSLMAPVLDNRHAGNDKQN